MPEKKNTPGGRIHRGCSVLPLPDAMPHGQLALSGEVCLALRLRRRRGDRLPVSGCKKQSYWPRDHLLRSGLNIGQWTPWGRAPGGPHRHPSRTPVRPRTAGKQCSCNTIQRPSISRKPPIPINARDTRWIDVRASRPPLKTRCEPLPTEPLAGARDEFIRIFLEGTPFGFPGRTEHAALLIIAIPGTKSHPPHGTSPDAPGQPPHLPDRVCLPTPPPA